VRIETPRGTVGTPNYEFGTSSVMLAEEFPDMYAKGPLSIDSSLVGFPLCVKDVNAAAQKTIQAGSENPVSSLSDYQRSCRKTMKRETADCVSQKSGLMRRSCLAKPSRVKAPDIEIGNPASRKPFAV
jgi:hypothetical protein